MVNYFLVCVCVCVCLYVCMCVRLCMCIRNVWPTELCSALLGDRVVVSHPCEPLTHSDEKLHSWRHWMKLVMVLFWFPCKAWRMSDRYQERHWCVVCTLKLIYSFDFEKEWRSKIGYSQRNTYSGFQILILLNKTWLISDCGKFPNFSFNPQY